MKKRIMITVTLCLAMCCFASCGKNQQVQNQKEEAVQTEESESTVEDEKLKAEGKEELENQRENTEEEVNTDKKEEQKVLIYYGNENADGIIYKEVTINGLSPESLIGELVKVNIVSVDTKVKSLSVDEKDSKLLHLDMSKEFGEYVSMMGTAGEYIVIGSLVDTFLDAYDCEHVIITVDGKALETGHASYDGALQFFEVYKTEE